MALADLLTPTISNGHSPNAAAARGGARVSGPRTNFIDPLALMRIKNMQMRARIVVEGFLAGIHRSPYHGFSVEFSEYRAYTPGDDPRYLDWRLYARSDRYSIKRFEDETNLLCYLVVDNSRSMGFRSGQYSKSDYARTLAASLAYFLSAQHDAVGLLTFDERVSDYVPPRHRPGQLRRLMGVLDREPAGKATDLITPLAQVTETVRKRGLVILISDLLAPLDELPLRLGHLRARGHDVVILRVLDPAELEFPFTAAGIFHDVESGRTLYVDPAVARAEYQRKFAAHAADLKQACVEQGIDFAQFTIDRPLELVLFDLLQARMRRGRKTVRHRARSRRAVR